MFHVIALMLAVAGAVVNPTPARRSPARGYFSTAEVAQLWGVHPKTVRNAIARGEIRGFMVSGRLRIPAEDATGWGRQVPSAGDVA